MRQTRHVGSIGTVVVMLAASACVKAPPVRTPAEVTHAPERWTAEVGVGTFPRDDWWRGFDDPALDAAIDAALGHNHDLIAAAARVERALAEARIAGADLKPSVSAGLRGSRQRQNFIGLPIPGGEGRVLSTTFDSLGLSLDVAWEVDLWGRLRAASRAALADLQAVGADWEAVRLSIAGQTAKAYFAVAEADRQVALFERTVESWRASYERIVERYERGLRSPLDVRLAASNLATAEERLAARRALRDRLTRQLEVLLGSYPAGARSTEGLPAPPPNVPAGLPAELVARRPDLVAAERRLAASDQRVLASRRALYPQLSLTASGGTASDQLSDLLDGDFRVWSVVGNLLQPILQGGRLRAGIDRAEAASLEAVASYAGAVLRAYAEVETALVADRYLDARERHVAEAAEQAAAARRLAADRYTSGLSGYIELLESQRRELDAEANLLSVRRERLENRVDLYLALGGGFERPGPEDVTPGRATGDARAALAPQESEE